MPNITMNILNHNLLNHIQSRLLVNSLKAIQPQKSLKRSVNIHATKGIDRMMNELYGLTEEEILIVEVE